MNFAPIIIPTLCRYSYFKKCIESLSQCSLANKTDVFIGLDYPSKESHREGYDKIKEYLKNSQRFGFNNLTIFEREYNFGPVKNYQTLIDYVLQKYDQFIYSEDDNIFSPNFLEYMNKGFEKYKDNKKVFAIVGYCHPYDFIYANNNYFFHRTDISAWGFGITKKQYYGLMESLSSFRFLKTFSLKNMWKISKYGYNRLYDYITLSLLNKRIKSTNDMVWSNYIQLNDMYVVVPTISKVKNIGWDVEGNSFNEKIIKTKRFQRIAKKHNEQDIDTEEHFEFVGSGFEFFDENNKIAVKESDGKISFVRMVYNLFRLLFKHYFKK